MRGACSVFSHVQYYNSMLNVTLGNEPAIAVNGIGNAYPSSSFSLSSVLYITNVPLNLMSVGKLTK